jgi:uncharacterized protein YndB with AHSA1/START domain
MVCSIPAAFKPAGDRDNLTLSGVRRRTAATFQTKSYDGARIAMKGVLILLAVLVTLLAVVTIVGAALPQEHAVTRRVRFNQSQEAVWNAISDFGAATAWRHDLLEARQLPDHNAHPVWRETSKDGTVLTLETVESFPPHRLVRRITDTGLQFGGGWTYEITPSNGGAQLSITENGEVYNPIFRFVSRFVVGHKASLDAYLKALGRKFGEEASITG